LDTFGPLKDLIKREKGGHTIFSLNVVFSFLNFGGLYKVVSKYHTKPNNWTFCVQRFKQLDSFGPLKDLIKREKGGHPVFSLNQVFSFLNFGKFVKLFQKTP